MKALKLNYIFRALDYFLWPAMWLLGGFVFPIQETHMWHVENGTGMLKG